MLLLRILSLLSLCYNKINDITMSTNLELIDELSLNLIPSNVAQTIPLLTCIRQVSGSNPGWHTHYPEILRDFPRFLHANAGTVTWIKPLCLPSTSFLIYFSLLSLILNKKFWEELISYFS
jgi:hypothetical protein